MTLLAVSVMVESLESAIDAGRRAAEFGADLVEYRIDRFTDHVGKLAELVKRSALPCIVTCRPRWEGGDYDGDEQTRVSLLELLGTGPGAPAFFDVEWEAYRKSANIRQKVDLVVEHGRQVRPVRTGLILSFHDFVGQPVDLRHRVAQMAGEEACRVVKIAWKAQNLADNLTAFELLRQRTKEMIALCMGEAGLPSRVLAKKFGGFLTFAALDKASATAPGQPTVEELKGLYRWDAIGPKTRVYGVIGCPVSHSLSPAIHNAGFGVIGHDGVYLPLLVEPGYEAFEAAVAKWLDFEGLDFMGASATMPHKENLLRFVRSRAGRVDEVAEQIGAANTLTRGPDGQLLATNTDCAAAVETVCSHLNIQPADLKGMRVAVIGAGGVARAVAVGFARQGATVVVYNRTKERAEELAAALSGRLPGKVVAARLEKLCDTCCEVLINCTPVGMVPDIEASPLSGVRMPGWGPETVVFDTIYNPAQTRLLREAREAGCRTIGGREMFVRQAAMQFQQWTGQAPPKGVFEEVLDRRLGQ